ncbi:hypothetical protein R1flu_028518 [Riccia fluitans]|uniref:Glycosyltransferase 2-like domain-containing protein n=1 Tax=Riccia fluitans TaxID=41844 RepID=A0ABD1XM03_9MARC
MLSCQSLQLRTSSSSLALVLLPSSVRVTFDNSSRLQRISLPPSRRRIQDCLEQAIGAEHGEGFATYRARGPLHVDVDFLNDRMRERGLQRIRYAMKPDEAFGLIYSWDNIIADTRALRMDAWNRLAEEEEDMNGPSVGGQSEVSVVKEQDVEIGTGEEGLWSIVIPTYNRLPILTQCLQALEEQVDYELGGIARYEVIVVDDGSTDGTVEFLLGRQVEAHEDDVHARKPKPNGESFGREGNYPELVVAGKKSSAAQQSRRFPHVKLVRQEHAGATKARNHGLKYASGAIIVFIDSDLVVTRRFLRAHGETLREAFREDGDDRAFTYGRVINTFNFKNPRSETAKLTDYSAAFFATGNVAISRRRLMEGSRLKHMGARIKHAPDAVGYHWHPAFSVDQLPRLIEQEKQRGRNGVRFYQKHPTLYVRLMIQMTPFHELLWFVLTLGGLLNEKTLEPLLRQLEMKDMNQIAAGLVSPVLNWHTVQAVKKESKKLKVN